MANEVIQRMQNHLDALAQGIPGENIEFWYARDLQEPLGYARWENFMTAIRRAMEACESTGYSVDDHFRGITKMVPLGSGAELPVDDFILTRYACYLVAMNGETRITDEHVQNNLSVRGMLGQRGIQPEHLPAEEDIKKLERRVKSDEKKLEKRSGKLPGKKAD